MVAVFSAPVEDAALGFLFGLLNHPAVQAFAFRFLDDFARHAFQDFLPLVGVSRVGEECGDERGSGGCQWPACRPYMECGDMPVPHILLVDGVERDLLQREGDFYEAFVVGHVNMRELIRIQRLNVRRFQNAR